MTLPHRHVRTAILVTAMGSLLPAAARAQSVHPVDDTNINLASPNQLNGTAASLFVRNVGSGGERHAYIRFDGSTLPAGLVVAKATLRVFVTAVNDAGPVNVHAVTGAWTEETLSAANAPPPGMLVGTMNVTASDENGFVVVDVTSVVQAWLAGTVPNGGLALLPTTADPVRITLDSKEATGTSHPPVLEVATVTAADVTAVTAGLGLSGGGASGDLALALDTAFTDGRYAGAAHGHDVSQVTNAATRGSNIFAGNQDIGGRVAANQSALPSSVIGQHFAASGQSIGVLGISNSTSGTGIVASAAATSGSTTGLLAYVDSASGVAAKLENRAGGDLITATSVGSALAFRVDGSGAVHAASYRDLAGNPIATGTGDITAVTAGTGLAGGGAAGDVAVALDTAFTDGRYAAAAHGHDVSQVANAAGLGPNLFSGTQTVAAGNLDLDASTPAVGTITKNGVRFLHDFGTSNTFLGRNAGNFSIASAGNTAVGFNALTSQTTGGPSTAVGFSALASNNGTGNTAIGYAALSANTSGEENSALGLRALDATTTGIMNTALGSQALRFNVTGSHNTAVGRGALSNNLGGFNTAVGSSANAANTSGTGNTVIGQSALFGNTTGSSNVAVGLNAGINATTGSNNIYLGADVQGVAGESNSMYLGRAGTQTATYIAGVRGTAVAGGEPVVIDAAGRLGSGSFAIGGDSIGSAQVIDESLTAADLGPGSVTASELAGGAVTADKVAFAFAGGATAGGPALDVACVGCIAATEVGFTYAGLAANTFGGSQTIASGDLNLVAGNLLRNGALFAHTSGANNTFFGLATGNTSTTGFGKNSGFGRSALGNLTDGSDNTAAGYQALAFNTSGNSNTAVGVNALLFNTTGGGNTTSGHFSMQSNTTGDSNTVAGYFTMVNNTSGSQNTAFGSSALSANTGGSGNTAVGLAALRDNTGSNNVAVGRQAGRDGTNGTNNIYLGADVLGVAGESNTMYLGKQGTQTTTYIAGVRGTTVTGGQVVLIDAAGRLGSGAAAVGGDSVGSPQVIDESLTAADLGPGSVAGSELAAGAVTADKVAFAYAGSVAAGGPAFDVACVGCIAATEVGFSYAGLGANTFTGTQTLDAGNLDLDASTATAGSITKGGTLFLHNFGTGNTFLGASAGNLSLTGDSNTGVGSQALVAATSGFGNSALGTASLWRNTTGVRNTAVGSSALRDNTVGALNTANGVNALLLNTTGQGNTATGFDALLNNVAGNFNTAYGINALLNATGSDNVAVGRNAGTNATAGSNNIYLGAEVGGVAGESNTMYLGRQGTQTKTLIAGVRGITTVNPDAIPVVIDSTGQLGTVSSSRRFKEDVRDMAEASRRLFALRPVTFRYAQPFGNGTKPIQYGLLAEEVAEVFPELAVRDADGRVETVHYETLNVLLLNELQRLHAELAEQRERVARLERLLTGSTGAPAASAGSFR